MPRGFFSFKNEEIQSIWDLTSYAYLTIVKPFDSNFVSKFTKLLNNKLWMLCNFNTSCMIIIEWNVFIFKICYFFLSYIIFSDFVPKWKKRSIYSKETTEVLTDMHLQISSQFLKFKYIFKKGEIFSFMEEISDNWSEKLSLK